MTTHQQNLLCGYTDRQVIEINKSEGMYKQLKEGEHRGLCDAITLHANPAAIQDRIQDLESGYNPCDLNKVYIRGQIIGLTEALKILGVS